MTRNNKKKANASVSSEDESGDKFEQILRRLACLDRMSEKINNMESMLSAVQAENKKLTETVQAQDKKILDLQTKLNNLEQHGRSFSVRVNNLSLEGVDEKEPTAVIKKVYEAVFLPILQGAASVRAISQVPTCFEMIEMAHPLPGANNKPKPIIVRFFNRNIKALLFKFRREYATKTNDAKPRYTFPFHDDLTRDTFIKLKQLQADPRVQSCWSTGGSLKFKLEGSNVIQRVSSVYLSNDDILK
jgi:hypothetical protein